MERIRKLFNWLNHAAEELAEGPEARTVREARMDAVPPSAAADESQLRNPERPSRTFDTELELARLAH